MAAEHKEQQSLYLRESVVAALRQIAEQTGTSMSGIADEFLEEAIRRYRSNTVTLRNVRVLAESLPDSLVDVEDDHPIFRSKKPKVVVTELRAPLAYVQ